MTGTDTGCSAQKCQILVYHHIQARPLPSDLLIAMSPRTPLNKKTTPPTPDSSRYTTDQIFMTPVRQPKGRVEVEADRAKRITSSSLSDMFSGGVIPRSVWRLLIPRAYKNITDKLSSVTPLVLMTQQLMHYTFRSVGCRRSWKIQLRKLKSWKWSNRSCSTLGEISKRK